MYQKVQDQSHLFGLFGFPWEEYYVRSSINGKGYTYLPDSTAEFLTMDLTATVGDTIHDIFAINEVFTCAGLFISVVVDSIIPVNVQGIWCDRYYLSSDCFPWNEGFHPPDFFWQEGLGTSFGPALAITGTFNPAYMVCAEVNNANVYSATGNSCGCIPYTSVPESASAPDISIIPGNIAGAFIIEHPRSLGIEVFSSCGTLVHQNHGLHFDISRQPPGIYIVRLRGKEFVWSQKIVR